MINDLTYSYLKNLSFTEIVKNLQDNKVNTSLDNLDITKVAEELTKNEDLGYVYTVVTGSGVDYNITGSLHPWGIYNIPAGATAANLVFTNVFQNSINSINYITNDSNNEVSIKFTSFNPSKIFNINGNLATGGVLRVKPGSVIAFARLRDSNNPSSSQIIRELYNTGNFNIPANTISMFQLWNSTSDPTFNNSVPFVPSTETVDITVNSTLLNSAIKLEYIFNMGGTFRTYMVSTSNVLPSFSTNEDIKQTLACINRGNFDPLLGVGIFRADNVISFGRATAFEGVIAGSRVRWDTVARPANLRISSIRAYIVNS